MARPLLILLGLLVAPMIGPAARADVPKPTVGLPKTTVELQGPIVVKRSLTVDLGAPWERFRGLVGIAAILGLAVALSENRRAISGRVLFWGLTLQWGFALLVLKEPAGERVLRRAGAVVEAVLGCATVGAEFVFGPKLVDPGGPAGFVFAIRVLPPVIFVAALFAVLYHLGIMQWVVRGLGWVMARL